MAALLFLAPLLLLGTVAGEGNVTAEMCQRLGNATEGNFSVEATPQTYKANTSYQVIIKDGRNHTKGQYLLQALVFQNSSVGEWKESLIGNCSSIKTALRNVPLNETHWISPNTNLSSVQIRIYLLSDNITEFKNLTLNPEANTTSVPSTTTPNSVGRAQSSSLLLAALQLPLLLLLGSLLS